MFPVRDGSLVEPLVMEAFCIGSPGGMGAGGARPLALCSMSPGTPKGVDFTTVKNLLLSVDGVEALHSLHIWALTVAQPVLSVHIAIGEYRSREKRPRAWGPSGGFAKVWPHAKLAL